MDARWCCPGTVFSFSSTPLFLLFFNHVVFLLSASRSINCAASSERTIAIIVCMFCGPIVLAHGCYMTREFRREVVSTPVHCEPIFTQQSSPRSSHGPLRKTNIFWAFLQQEVSHRFMFTHKPIAYLIVGCMALGYVSAQTI